MKINLDGSVKDKILLVHNKAEEDFTIGIPSLDTEFKKTLTNKSQLVWYLEECYAMDELDDIEWDIYDKHTYGVHITDREWIYVYRQMLISNR